MTREDALEMARKMVEEAKRRLSSIDLEHGRDIEHGHDVGIMDRMEKAMYQLYAAALLEAQADLCKEIEQRMRPLGSYADRSALYGLLRTIEIEELRAEAEALRK